MVKFIYNGKKYAIKNNELVNTLLVIASEKPVLRSILILKNVSRETLKRRFAY